MDFNISHSGKYVFCIVSSDCRVGIDIERIKPVDIPLFKNYFKTCEIAKIEKLCNLNNYKVFFDFWTKNEAVAKADGRGLSVPFHEINISDLYAEIHGEFWYLYELKIIEGYSIHLAQSIPTQIPFSVEFCNLLYEDVYTTFAWNDFRFFLNSFAFSWSA